MTMTLTPFLRYFLSYFGLAPGDIQSDLKKVILDCKFQILGIKTTMGHYIIIFSRNASCPISDEYIPWFMHMVCALLFFVVVMFKRFSLIILYQFTATGATMPVTSCTLKQIPNKYGSRCCYTDMSNTVLAPVRCDKTPPAFLKRGGCRQFIQLSVSFSLVTKSDTTDVSSQPTYPSF